LAVMSFIYFLKENYIIKLVLGQSVANRRT